MLVRLTTARESLSEHQKPKRLAPQPGCLARSCLPTCVRACVRACLLTHRSLRPSVCLCPVGRAHPPCEGRSPGCLWLCAPILAVRGVRPVLECCPRSCAPLLSSPARSPAAVDEADLRGVFPVRAAPWAARRRLSSSSASARLRISRTRVSVISTFSASLYRPVATSDLAVVIMEREVDIMERTVD